MPHPSRGEVWMADLGIAAKLRPGLVLSIALDPQDRVLFTLVPHTTSTQGTRFEVVVPKPFLQSGAFDAQGLATVPARACDASSATCSWRSWFWSRKLSSVGWGCNRRLSRMLSLLDRSSLRIGANEHG